MRRRGARLAALVLLAGAVALGLVPPAAPAGSAAPASPPPAEVSQAAAGDGYARTRTVGRSVLRADGTPDPALSSSYDVTVTADHTRNLRGRERVHITWRGARPSAGRAANPYGATGMQQEYPVVVMQCRGRDDATLPADQQLRPETCWTSSWNQRTLVNDRYGVWRLDRYADPADRVWNRSVDPYPAVCESPVEASGSTVLTPFVSRSGKSFAACDKSLMPPEAGIDGASPPAEIAAFTDLDGTGSVNFEVRSDTEYESLGCNDKVACSIVVIPITGISCDRPAGATLTRAERECRKTGQNPPGSSAKSPAASDLTVSPTLWWAASNWRNRFSIPISFGLPPGVCDIADPRPPTSFYGSELMAQAALQWAPAYCLRKDRFKFKLSQMPDQSGWTTMEKGTGPAAFVAARHEQTGQAPVGYAPTAVTGFAVGYTIDKDQNAGEYDQLRLNARLLAKLLTQSYVGDLGRDHPGMGTNPAAIMKDPEFIELNPGLSQITSEAGATVLSLSISSDVIRQLTAYLAQDADAMAFIGGKADRWGMVVNPSYKDIALPLDEWPLLDTWVVPPQSDCLKANQAVYLSQVAAPVSTLRTVAELLIDGQPNVQTRCEWDPSLNTWKLGKVERQSYGSRFMLGIVSLGDAERFGLHTAALETTEGHYVRPDDKSMAAAVRLMTPADGPHSPFEVAMADLVAARNAYPGTMVVSTAARLRDMPKADARRVAQFVRVATSEGQVRGRGNGQLPAGYLPLREKGPTAALWRAAQTTADAIEAQRGPATGPGNPDGATPGAGPGSGGTPATGTPPGAGAAAGGPAAPKGGAGAPGAADGLVPTAATVRTESPVGRFLLPALILFGGLAAASSVVSRLVGSRGRWQ